MDELEGYPTIFRHELKRDAKAFAKSMEKVLNTIYKDIDEIESDQGFNLINVIHDNLEEVYKFYEKHIEDERQSKGGV